MSASSGADEAFGTSLFEVDAVDILGARSEQQDAFGVSRVGADSMILALADGMGGHANGALASSLAIENFVGTAKSGIEGGDTPERAFDVALDAANAALADQLAHDGSDETMGTTLIGVLLTATGLSWISVGDSVLWLWRAGKLLRLNEDHSLRAVERFKESSKGNMLTSALTGASIADVDRRPAPVALLPGDVVILASDGILSVEDTRLAMLLRLSTQASVREIGDAMIEAVVAERNPKQDNTTLVVARVRETPLPERSGTRHPHARRHRTGIGLLMPALMLIVAAATATIACLTYIALRVT